MGAVTFKSLSKPVSNLDLEDVFAYVGLELGLDFVGFGFKEGSRLGIEQGQVFCSAVELCPGSFE